MSNNLNFIIADKVYSKITDGTHDSPKQREVGKPLITSKHIKGRNIDFESAYLISEADFNKINERSQVHKWDVIVSMIGEYCGYCYVERNENINYAVKNVGLYKTGSKLEAEWLYYYLISPIGKAILNSVKSGSSQPYLTLGGLRKLPILQPVNKESKVKIVKVLSDLDAKIELNNKINAELEAMVKTLYDYWFVQFDFPDANGKSYKSSGGKMVWNEELKREIPEGWGVVKLADLGNFKNGVNYDPSNPGEVACPIINVRNISASSYFIKNSDLDVIYLSENDVRKYSVHKGSIIIARSGIPGATRLISDMEPNTLYCGFAIHYELTNLSNKLPIFFYLKSIEEMIKNGSGGTILKNVNQATLNNLKVALPNNEFIISRFNELIEPLFDKINLIEKENQEITSLRDWLLPMLMNGQVTVASTSSATEEQLGMVAEDKVEYKKG